MEVEELRRRYENIAPINVVWNDLRSMAMALRWHFAFSLYKVRVLCSLREWILGWDDTGTQSKSLLKKKKAEMYV